MYYNRLGIVAQYIQNAETYLTTRAYQFNKHIPFSGDHKKMIGEIISNDYPICKKK